MTDKAWVNIIERTMKGLPKNESNLTNIYNAIRKMPEAEDKVNAVGKAGNPVNWQGQVRAIMVRDPRFVKGDVRGQWFLRPMEDEGHGKDEAVST